MKRAAALILCILLLLPSLAACHGARKLAPFTMPASFDDRTPVEIVFWAKYDTNQAQSDIYRKAIEDFTALYPNISVTLRLYTDYGRIYQDVITNIPTGTTPNVCITYPDHIATYKTGENVVTPLTALLDDPKYGLGGSELRFDGPRRDELVPEFLAECMLDGEYWALPFMRSTEACYVNKTYVEKLGFTLPEVLTWDFVWQVSEAAMAKDQDGNFLVNGQNAMIPFIYKSTDNMMISMLRQLNAGYSTSDGEILIFNDTTRSILKEIAAHCATRSFSTFKRSSYPGNWFNAGQCIFAVDSTAGAAWMGGSAPHMDISAENAVDFETVVMEIPQADPANQKMISQGPSVCVFNKSDPQEVLASWLFAQFLLTNGVQKAYAGTEGYVPVTLKAQNDPEYLDYLARSGEDNDTHYRVKIEAAQLLMAHTDDTFVTPVFNGSAALREASGQMIEDVVNSVYRKTPVDDSYIDALFEDIPNRYHLKMTSGEIPAGSIALIVVIVAIWAILGLWNLFLFIKKKKS